MSALKPIALVLSVATIGTVVFALGPRSADDTAERPQTEARKRSRARAPVSTSARTPASSQAHELADLRHQVRKLTEHQESEAEGSPASDEEYVADEDTVEPPRPERSPGEIAEALEEVLFDQPRDSGATQTAATHMADVFAAAGAGQLLDIDCGDRLCRSHIAFDDAEQRDARLSEVGSLVPWDADGFFHSDPEDANRVALYFSREGQPLPSLDEAG